tara:strand:+ start:156 stop:446 length:291 start_codon:yes stop_codon:yes gene_type:complete
MGKYINANLKLIDKFEDVMLSSDKYTENFEKCLELAVDKLFDKKTNKLINIKSTLGYFMKKYYWSHEQIESDNLPIDNICRDFNIQIDKKSNMYIL